MPSSTDDKAVRSAFRGFTIVELMVAMVVLSIMLIGLSNLWIVVDDYFFRLQLRQKAVFKLSGEMERLSAFSRFTGMLGQSATHADNKAPQNRWIYRADPPNLSGVASMVVQVATISGANAATWTDDQVLFINSSATNASTESNIVWLDRTNNITAKFEWEVVYPLDTDCRAPGCAFVEARMIYPYRFVANVDAAQTSMGTVSTIAIRAWMGARN